MAQSCSHLEQIKFKSTDTHVCEDCVKTGDKWVHLRLSDMRTRWLLRFLQEPPCDQAFPRSKHPLIRSIEPGEAWIWCYVDELSPGEVAA